MKKELIEKAKTAQSAEELLELAKAEGVDATAREAEEAFARLHRKGELADEELDNVSGGCVNPSPQGLALSESEVKHLYHVGQTVEYIVGFGTERSAIEKLGIVRKYRSYFPAYDVREIESKKLHENVEQCEIQIP